MPDPQLTRGPDDPSTWDDGPPPSSDPESADVLDSVLTAKAAAAAFEVGYEHLLQYLKVDALPSKRIGRSILVLREDVEAFLRAHPNIPSRFTRGQA